MLTDDRFPLEDRRAPSVKAMEEAYFHIFGTPSEPDDEPLNHVKPCPIDLWRPVSLDEIRKILDKRCSDAAGPDGITPSDIKRRLETLSLHHSQRGFQPLQIFSSSKRLSKCVGLTFCHALLQHLTSAMLSIRFYPLYSSGLAEIRH